MFEGLSLKEWLETEAWKVKRECTRENMLKLWHRLRWWLGLVSYSACRDEG